MASRKGFTLIEPMVAIFIVGVLAAETIPIMRGRIDSAKWSEAKAAMGSIRTAARAYEAEKGMSYSYAGTTLTNLGFILRKDGATVSDLDGKYFTEESYSVAMTGYDVYTITCDATRSTCTEKPTTPSVVVLNQAGTFTETP